MPTRDPLADRARSRLKALMARQDGMTQIELARRAGERQQRVHRFLKGQMPYPPLTFLNRLAHVFSLTLCDLIGPEVPRPPKLAVLHPRVRETAAILEGLDENRIRLALAIARSWQSDR